MRLKALMISEVTVEHQIWALVCCVSVALIRKIAKRNENINFRLRSLMCASRSWITLLSHLNTYFSAESAGSLCETMRRRILVATPEHFFSFLLHCFFFTGKKPKCNICLSLYCVKKSQIKPRLCPVLFTSPSANNC